MSKILYLLAVEPLWNRQFSPYFMLPLLSKRNWKFVQMNDHALLTKMAAILNRCWRPFKSFSRTKKVLRLSWYRWLCIAPDMALPPHSLSSPLMKSLSSCFYTLPHHNGGVFWFLIGRLCVCLSVICLLIHLYFPFQMITSVNVNGFSPNLVCALIFMEIQYGIAHDNGQILTIFDRVSAGHMSVFLFPDNNLNKYQWIFNKLGMCIDIVKVWFRIANRQISSIFDSYLPATCHFTFF